MGMIVVGEAALGGREVMGQDRFWEGIGGGKHDVWESAAQLLRAKAQMKEGLVGCSQNGI
jgi:hypothetical protein